jgi:hypothetical protein
MFGKYWVMNFLLYNFTSLLLFPGSGTRTYKVAENAALNTKPETGKEVIKYTVDTRNW